MKALLMRMGAWPIVSGKKLRPLPVDEKQHTAEKTAAMDKWDDMAYKAAGELFLNLSTNQRTHVQGLDNNPVTMWVKLESVHLQKHPSACFNAWDAFFSIKKEPDEFLSSLMTRIESGIQKVQNLHPQGYTLDKLEEELVCMMMARSLPFEFDSFASSLQLLDKFEKSKL
ncbi:hypothetical protein ABKN59_012087 [Abortiporus biennis]